MARSFELPIPLKNIFVSGHLSDGKQLGILLVTGICSVIYSKFKFLFKVISLVSFKIFYLVVSLISFVDILGLIITFC